MQHSWEKCWHTGNVLHQTRQKCNRQGEGREARGKDCKVKVMRRQSGENGRMTEEVEGRLDEGGAGC